MASDPKVVKLPVTQAGRNLLRETIDMNEIDAKFPEASPLVRFDFDEMAEMIASFKADFEGGAS